jgi:hypothetical protein
METPVTQADGGYLAVMLVATLNMHFNTFTTSI